MFSTGNFKNNIGENTSFERPDPNDSEYNQVIPIKIELGNDYAWAAMDETARKDAELTQLAPTVTHSNKCLFVVRVTYYLQVVVLFGLLKRPVAIKLPFLLQRTDTKKNEPTIILETSSCTKDSKSEIGVDDEAETDGSKTQTEVWMNLYMYCKWYYVCLLLMKVSDTNRAVSDTKYNKMYLSLFMFTLEFGIISTTLWFSNEYLWPLSWFSYNFRTFIVSPEPWDDNKATSDIIQLFMETTRKHENIVGLLKMNVFDTQKNVCYRGKVMKYQTLCEIRKLK